MIDKETLERYSYELGAARDLIAESLRLTEPLFDMFDMSTEKRSKLKESRRKIWRAWNKLGNLDRAMHDNNSDVDLHSWVGSHTDARGHKVVARLGERKPDKEGTNT